MDVKICKTAKHGPRPECLWAHLGAHQLFSSGQFLKMGLLNNRGFEVSWNQGFRFSSYLGFEFLRFRSFRVSRFLGIKVSWFLGIKGSGSFYRKII
jgi:hypothetical protein